MFKRFKRALCTARAFISPCLEKAFENFYQILSTRLLTRSSPSQPGSYSEGRPGPGSSYLSLQKEALVHPPTLRPVFPGLFVTYLLLKPMAQPAQIIGGSRVREITKENEHFADCSLTMDGISKQFFSRSTNSCMTLCIWDLISHESLRADFSPTRLFRSDPLALSTGESVCV